MEDRHEHHHILEIWQETVGIQLDEDQADDFLSRPEVARLARMPARQRLWAARTALGRSAPGRLPLRDWLACAAEYHDPCRGPDSYLESITGRPPSPRSFEPDVDPYPRDD